MRLRYILAMLCLMLLPYHAGYSIEMKRVTLDEAGRIALENNHDYKIASIRVKQADERVSAVWGELFPALESEASATRQDAEKGFMSLSDGQYDLRFVQMRFGINPGIFYNNLQQSRKMYMVASEDMKRIKSEIELQVIRSYFAIIVADEMIKLRRDSIDLLKTNLKDVERLYSTGSIAKFDLLQARVQLNSQYPLLLEAENNYRTAIDYFNYVLGAPGRVTADSSIMDKSVVSISDEGIDEKIEYLTSAAMKNRPELVQVRKKIEASMHRESMYDSYYIWPTFTVGGNYGMTKNDPNKISLGFPGPVQPDFSQLTGDDKWQKTWQVRVAATYRWGSLFGLDSNSSLSKGESLAADEGREEFMKLKKIISININSCYSRLITSYLTIVSQRENVETASEGLRIARESFKAGVIKNSDLITSELALTSARTGYINAVNSYYTALGELKRETGINDESIIFGKVKK